MKNIKYISFIGLIALAFLFACEPYQDTKPELGIVQPPAESEMDFSITPGEDDYRYNIELTSPQLSGIHEVSFTLGNGSSISEKSGVAYYPVPGEYTITMTIKTNAGSTTISKTHTTTATDYSLFDDPMIIALSGGVDDLDGNTWVLDSLAPGHLGVGPAGSEGLEWWSAAPLAKQAVDVLYDDRMTFKLVGFEFIYENHGESYVKDYRSSDPAYSNPEERDTDYKVEFNPAEASWALAEEDGKWMLTLSPTTAPVFPIFDVGAVGNKYEVLTLEENKLELVATGGDGNAWHYKFIPEGYVPPQVEFEVTISEGADVNSFDVAHNVINVPAGESIDKVRVNFGDGNVVETTDVNEVLSNVYMRKGNFLVTVTTTTSIGEEVTTVMADVPENHPDYEEFQLDQVVMYADFSEIAMAPVEGENCLVAVSDNPDRTYPNKSANVAFYSKTDQQWANAFMKLPTGFRFDLRLKHTFSIKVYGKAGDEVLLKLENTDKGADAYKTGTADFIYTIQEDNTWEIATFDFSGVAAGWEGNGDIFTSDIVTDDNFNHDFYNVIRIMLNPGVGEGTHEFYFDELAGPHVEGLKSAQIR